MSSYHRNCHFDIVRKIMCDGSLTWGTSLRGGTKSTIAKGLHTSLQIFAFLILPILIQQLDIFIAICDSNKA